MRNAVRRGWIEPGQTVFVVSTATGLKFTESAAENLKGNITFAKKATIDEVARILQL